MMKAVLRILPLLLPGLASSASASGGALRQADNLKEIEGVEVVREQCLACHDDSYITSMRLPREEWEGLLEVMVGMGMEPLEGEMRETVLDYLSTAQGTGPDGESEGAEAAGGDAAALAAPDLPWAEPRYAPVPLSWRRPGAGEPPGAIGAR